MQGQPDIVLASQLASPLQQTGPDQGGSLQVLVAPGHVHMRKLGIELLSLRWDGRTLWAPAASVLAGVPGPGGCLPATQGCYV